ncbi:DUF4440 domain-containing protein [Clostridium sp. KNHs214]|uniref:nuclear transport factor 2 family protein n=1 Tax=Clostridium sp. KNHs214 TaxID=1540257 RepID=UPI00054D0738|nr:DUF4440 domain-containing protein [Clostridium sp. KNHs214]
MINDNDMLKQVIDLEKKSLKSEIRASREELDRLIADEFIEFCSSGFVCDKKDVLEGIPNSKPIEINAYDFKGKILSKEVALITYYTIIGTGDGVKAMRSSIWKLLDNRWQLIFHQGTKVKNKYVNL